MKTPLFRDKIQSFIAANIQADINGADTETIKKMPKLKEVTYSRPADP